MSITPQALYDVLDATWPAAKTVAYGPWTLRDGAGGGKRVSAATANGSVTEIDVTHAETAMTAMGQTPLFMIRDDDDALDQMLGAMGYDIVDPVVMYACPAALLTDIPIPRVTVFTIWEPLAMMVEIWAKGGIGPARLDVMHRAAGPKTGFMARWNEKPAGAGFGAIYKGTAMLHAIEILSHQRQQGVAKWMMRQAAFWAVENGAPTLSVVCTTANEGANRLYTSLGMDVVGHYHYRQKPGTKDMT